MAAKARGSGAIHKRTQRVKWKKIESNFIYVIGEGKDAENNTTLHIVSFDPNTREEYIVGSLPHRTDFTVAFMHGMFNSYLFILPLRTNLFYRGQGPNNH